MRHLIECFYEKYHVIELNRTILIKASDIGEKHCFSFWDSLIFASALHENVDILYSEDMQTGFIVGKTRLINPFNQ